MKCEKCKWWKKLPKSAWQFLGSPIGECHFMSPKPGFINRNKDIEILNLVIEWPLTRTDDFCSNFYDVNVQEIVEQEEKESWWKKFIK